MSDTTIEKRLHEDPLAVDASPTKAFFVHILTKDIQLDRSIADLLDNCVDGAKRLRPGEDADLHGLKIELKVSSTGFEISDNCGGIALQTARHYAFKFGRALGFEETPFSVGQFGVGMKRALFKIGRQFTVTTTTKDASFQVPVDVEEWIKTEPWDFRVANLVERSFPTDLWGTRVEVTKLYDGIAQTFGSEMFQRNLRNQIRVVQQHFMRLGMQISLNDEVVIPNEWQLRSGSGLEPSYRRFEDEIEGAVLRTRVYCGVSDSSRAHAGWYVFCNGRCILEADQSVRTGWGESDSPAEIPKYHGQYSRFRGYAFLDCANAAVLPWNTTKTDLDPETVAYRRLHGRIVDAARPVIDFLNRLDAESDFAQEDRDLTRTLSAAASLPLERITERPTFSFRPLERRPPPLTGISFKKPPEKVEALREALSARNPKNTGELAFDYAYHRLVDET